MQYMLNFMNNVMTIYSLYQDRLPTFRAVILIYFCGTVFTVHIFLSGIML
jgi:hypothetical protein